MVITNNSIQCHPYHYGSETYDEAVRLREAVLRIPLGLTWAPHDFDAEDVSFHLGAFVADQLVGTLILRPREQGVIQMRQVAVAPAWQSQGIGSVLVRYAEQYAILQGYTTMVAHARQTALAFYTRLEYRTVGQMFTEVGIPHVAIEKSLPGAG